MKKIIEFNYHHAKHYKIQNKSKKTLWISLLLTAIFAMLELFGGIISGSLALVSDSFHMISDVIALIFSMLAIYYSTKKPTDRYTYGYLRVEIIAAFLNGIALVIISFGIINEAIKRIINPQEINFNLMITIAIIGLIINIVLTLVLMNSLKYEDNLNIKSALWHFLGDLLNSIGVIITGILVKYTGIILLDPIISSIISIVIMIGGIKIIRKALNILMEAVPEELDINKIRNSILDMENIENIHEFHMWSISEGLHSLSFHVILKEYNGVNDYKIIKNISNMLKEVYKIDHVTIQIEDPEVNIHKE
ncbi:cation diffusion facilitator family transporter [Streptobacillus moniliformis]|uniref:Cation diffusion facilitator family transporter n=1 Tax=Streptobacillus moniliformis (strain ATCC 14647 / DSM 12112 / NCTC 10651 / 9901) TaxID=519441 RepID=D1AVV6_STRM9|nr:cation diffusion facilitator family transporter [Streptobacillus moniliformis]ACZ01866.1 cation diffusion facilitator family transporter [Streptobacillus moniliformis DSM 12112]AVL43140.1 cation transporter [Streptobacillus moniliformis]QXW65217.1 cation diffusion facilitator family transporter [Streptobacillus moniliformis]SQA12928.1 Cadmium, cobalt and zinc/H(+)-K(+) antiporter [Streptobacillus moniliformis]